MIFKLVCIPFFFLLPSTVFLFPSLHSSVSKWLQVAGKERREKQSSYLVTSKDTPGWGSVRWSTDTNIKGKTKTTQLS